MEKVIIGIDPDAQLSGVARLECAPVRLEAMKMPFAELIDYLRGESAVSGLTVVVEAGWLNKGNWHLRGKDNLFIARAKGDSVGRNHETGRKIVEMCRHFGIDTVEQRPLKKIWRGQDGKITDSELKSFVPLNGRTNQEMRDAVLLAWNYAGLPVCIL